MDSKGAFGGNFAWSSYSNNHIVWFLTSNGSYPEQKVVYLSILQAYLVRA